MKKRIYGPFEAGTYLFEDNSDRYAWIQWHGEPASFNYVSFCQRFYIVGSCPEDFVVIKAPDRVHSMPMLIHDTYGVGCGIPELEQIVLAGLEYGTMIVAQPLTEQDLNTVLTGSSWLDRIEIVPSPPPTPVPRLYSLTCECGADAVSAPGHYSWCPKHSL